MKKKKPRISKKELEIHTKYTEALDFMVNEIQTGEYSQADIIESVVEFSKFVKEKFGVKEKI